MNTITENKIFLSKKVTINMPQMAIEALSENWLFKELGDLHWEMICKGLNTLSFDLKNDIGERLYATFVRIRINCAGNLKSFKENQVAKIEGTMNRYGNSMYFSNIDIASDTSKINATLMTTFSIRDKVDNTKLSKAEPNTAFNEVEALRTFPAFGNEYRLVKKKVLKELSFDNYSFEIVDDILFETAYDFNPFYDINGVNLLYFAAYPIINDVCEAKYFHTKLTEERWEQAYYTAYKDVFYYANCNLNDSIIYQLVSVEQIEETSYKLSSILRRKSDGAIIARIFSIKSKLSLS